MLLKKKKSCDGPVEEGLFREFGILFYFFILRRKFLSALPEDVLSNQQCPKRDLVKKSPGT